MAKTKKRRSSREVKIGAIAIGGDNPVAVQTMVNTPPDQVDLTVNEINRAAECGAEIVRVAVPDKRSALALVDIKKGTEITMTFEGEDTIFAVNGVEKGGFKGREFARAVLKCWLGKYPPNKELKSGMLGRS